MILKCYDYGCLEKPYLRCHALDHITLFIHHLWSHELKLTPPTVSRDAIRKDMVDLFIVYMHINQLRRLYFLTLLMNESYNI